MLSIYLCDDSKEQLTYFSDIISNYLLLKDFDMELVLSTKNPQELLDFVSSAAGIGLYFLDVDFGVEAAMDGFLLAQKIRSYDPRCFIVFITSHGNWSLQTFQYHLEAMDYITKEEPAAIKQRMQQCLDRAYDLYLSVSENAGDVFKIRSQSKSRYINIKDILYITTSKCAHQVIIVTFTGTISIYKTLNECQDELKKGFVRCHNSCLVNKSHIAEVNHPTRSLLVDNGDILPVSLKSRKYL